MITTLIDEDLIHFRKGKKIWNRSRRAEQSGMPADDSKMNSVFIIIQLDKAMTSEKTTFIQQTMITTLIDEDLIHFRKGKKIWNRSRRAEQSGMPADDQR